MAQLSAPTPEVRVSQILPSVKCSNCNQPVAIAELGDHVCAPLPPVPSLPSARPPMSPKSTTALLPAKYQNLVSSSRSQPPQASQQTSSRQASNNTPSSDRAHPASPPRRSRVPSTASSFSTLSGESRVTSPPPRGTSSNVSKVMFPTSPGPSEPLPPQRMATPVNRGFASSPDVSSPLSGRSSSSASRSATPGRYQTPQPSPPTDLPQARPRAPSSASSRPSALSPNSIRHPVQSSPAPLSPPLASGSRTPASLRPGASVRPRATTNASAYDDNSDVIYSTDHRVNVPTLQQAPRARAPSNASVRRPSHEQRPPPPSAGTPPIRSPPLGSPPVEPNTASGGSAGMAGVGRRGFAAAARAAMFTLPGPPGSGPEQPREPWSNMAPTQGMDGRRANAPKFLDIASAANYSSAHTPPLSPGSATSSLSPHTPHSQKSPVSADLYSPSSRHSTTPTNAGATPAIASTPSSPGGSFVLKDRSLPPALEPPKAALPVTPATPTTPASIRLPFFEKFKNKLPELDTGRQEPFEFAKVELLSPDSPESEYGGLAYADSNADEDDVSVNRKRDDTSADDDRDMVRFPSIAASESQYTASEAPSPRLPMRSLSASTGASSYTVRTAAKSTGALDRALDTLFEDPLSPTSTASPGMFPKPLAPDGQRDSKAPKLPARSHTSPTLGAGRAAEKKRSKVRVCVRCEKTVEDGRWIQMDGGSVLCDRCWKNMYLPKCRRCNLTIEKQAVSSSDGQLKGKYHRACFNCHTCHKPFPDKSFYVFDGKPFCAYHYHEANNSLCAAVSCGEPIEGPCAVSHSGHRYHPEHMVCEYSRCTERLAEYYEVDGRMLCERHAQIVMNKGTDEEDEDIVADARAMKRTTRFIDLSMLGNSELR
ncbi:hypothetical protein B0H21DRAFT_13958 [Amylocystis lapponica]|nr:hypothetical protein B0H21DRAFT_13958 [Amylocystis lapponica]